MSNAQQCAVRYTMHDARCTVHGAHGARCSVQRALALTLEVEMTIPGMVTRLETWLDSNLRMLIGCFDEISVICKCTSSCPSSTIEVVTAASRAA